MRILVFGDSITQGYWAVEHGWVDLVRRHFDSRQVTGLKKNNEPSVFNLGVSADNSDNILVRFENEILARTRPTHAEKPVIILQIGVNDSSLRGDLPQTTPARYRKNLHSLAEKGKVLGSKVIFVGLSACDDSRTTPVAWGEYYYRSETIKQYEQIMSEVAKAENIGFIPVFDIFAAELAKNPELVPDGLHPNDEGHETIYKIVITKLEEML